MLNAACSHGTMSSFQLAVLFDLSLLKIYLKPCYTVQHVITGYSVGFKMLKIKEARREYPHISLRWILHRLAWSNNSHITNFILNLLYSSINSFKFPTCADMKSWSMAADIAETVWHRDVPIRMVHAMCGEVVKKSMEVLPVEQPNALRLHEPLQGEENQSLPL
jgi:hypothetical protein